MTGVAGNIVVSQTITVVERRQARVESAFFDTSPIPLYSSTPGLGG